MEQEFNDYLIRKGYKTAKKYKDRIHRISEHYSEKVGQEIDIYKITEQNKINEIARQYRQGGIYAEAGSKGKGKWRRSIDRYTEFFVNRNYDTPDDNLPAEINTQNAPENNQVNFAYERDLQNTLRTQIDELFPNYKIYGENEEGIEYSIDDGRIDVLLEHKENNNLLAVELKSGKADYKVFGQISMYIGLLQEQFTDRKVSGVIISGSIGKGLRQACTTTDKIELKTYKMNLELKDA